MGAAAEAPGGRWSERGTAYAASRDHVAGPSLARLLLLADPRRGESCLDIGTGAGHTAARRAVAGAEVVGLDPAPGMLDAARRRYGERAGLRFVEARGDATGMPDAAFDLVTARHTLHHHPDPRATLREVARVLRPGGRFVLVDEITPDARVDDWLDAVERARDATHVRAYTLDAWRVMLAEAGLRWVTGDGHTRYRMEIDAWTGRMGLSDSERVEVRRLFREAGPLERRLFSIEYEGGEAVRFALPMAVVLAARPAKGETA